MRWRILLLPHWPDPNRIPKSQLGLLYAFSSGGELFFCPTGLAASLCGGQTVLGLSGELAGGHIIVETNYRVYAYTSSPIQIAILELFCKTEAIMPNLFVGESRAQA